MLGSFTAIQDVFYKSQYPIKQVFLHCVQNSIWSGCTASTKETVRYMFPYTSVVASVGLCNQS